MAQKDWLEVLEIFDKQQRGYIHNFLESNSTFCPDFNFENIFDRSKDDFSSKDLNKKNPAGWIPIYLKSQLPNDFHDKDLMPIRSGTGSFFFYKGSIFQDLECINYTDETFGDTNSLYPFIPTTLLVNFKKNENAYINKALYVGIINSFLDESKPLQHGQSGMIKLTSPISFKTSQETRCLNDGLQFEVDMVLESEDEIIIIEAKQSSKGFQKEFSLLQLYYPLMYFSDRVKGKKSIRTIFFDVNSQNDEDIYKLLEFKFLDNCFDKVEVCRASLYRNTSEYS